EATSLAVLAQMAHGHSPGVTKRALAWLASQRDGRGTWHSTQATVLALKALFAGTQPGGGAEERRIELALGAGFRKEFVIPADQAEVVQQLDLTPYLRPGTQTLSLAESTKGATGYQVSFRYHVPEPKAAEGEAPFVLNLGFDRTSVPVGEAV